MKFFKPEDFTFILEGYNNYAADSANKKLNALIESWPVVYSTKPKKESSSWHFHDNNQVESFQTHKARLAFIEEIVKEPCKHEPEHIFIGPETGNWSTSCKHCGVELQATWSAK